MTSAACRNVVVAGGEVNQALNKSALYITLVPNHWMDVIVQFSCVVHGLITAHY